MKMTLTVGTFRLVAFTPELRARPASPRRWIRKLPVPKIERRIALPPRIGSAPRQLCPTLIAIEGSLV